MKKILVMNFGKHVHFIGSDLDKFKLETQLTILTQIVYEKQVGKKMQ